MALTIEDFVVTEDLVKAAKEMFNKFDKKGTGKISTNDIIPAFKSLNMHMNADKIKEWADMLDENATGALDLESFLILYGKTLKEEADERDLREAFRMLDKNKRGEIDTEDLRWILKELGGDLTEDDIDEMIRDTDKDGSGYVDFDEFYKLMTS